MDSKGKVRKPVVDPSGDQVDPKTPPTKTPKEHGGKEYVGKDYKSSKKGEKGLGDPCHCNDDLVYEPSDDSKSSKHPPAKIPTAEQASICSLVADAIRRDHTMIETLVNQLRRENLIAPIVAEMLQHKETFNGIAEVMAHESYGPPVCKRLARAMNEEIAAPFHASMEDEDEEELEQPEDEEMGDPMDSEMEMEDEEMGMEDDEIEMDGEMAPEMEKEVPPAVQNLRKAMSRF